MLANAKRIYALAEFTVESRPKGWYFWRTYGGGKKLAKGPYSSEASVCLIIAGNSCAMINTDANKALRAVHDRMPVLLAPENFDAWLNGVAGTELLTPAPAGMLRSWPVSKRVNRPGNDDDATLIEPLVA